MLFRDLLYVCVLVVLSPWLCWRAYRTGRYRRDLKAKLLGLSAREGRFSRQSSREVAWFHGVSVGEIHLLVPVIAAFRKRHPEFDIAVSSTTETGLAEARSKFSDFIVVAFPFDFSWAVRATLDEIHPKFVILAESELWPNFLAITMQRSIPVVVINARMSPRSFSRLKSVAGLARSLLFRPITAFAVQSEDYAERLRQLGVPEAKLTVTGSVKFDGATGARNTPQSQELRRVLGPTSSGGLMFVVGSTHAPEEEILLHTFLQLRTQHPKLRMILVPRHPDRFEEVATLLKTAGVPFARRSQLKDPLPTPPEILLLDTVGELGAAWSLADVGFTGGSLDGKRGGQSMIEPAGYGVPVVFGPHIWNFRDAGRRLVEMGGAILVKEPEELLATLQQLFSDAELRSRMARISKRFVEENQGATAKTLDVIDRVLGFMKPTQPPGVDPVQ